MPACRAFFGDPAARSIMPLLLVSFGLLFWFASPASAQAAAIPLDAAAASMERSPAPGSHTRDRLLTLPWLSADRSNPVLLKPRRGACPEIDDGPDAAATAAVPDTHSAAVHAVPGCDGRSVAIAADAAHAFRSRAPPRPRSIPC